MRLQRGMYLCRVSRVDCDGVRTVMDQPQIIIFKRRNG